MPEPFKEIYSKAFVTSLGEAAAGASPGFPAKAFVKDVLGEGYGDLGLKERVSRIARALGDRLGGDLEGMLPALFAVNKGFGGLGGLVFGELVAQRGVTPELFDVSMEALKRFTVGSSSEFGVRPFLRSDLKRAMGHVAGWARDPDHEVRRLASEGSRPRLPWGGFIEGLVEDPGPILGMLGGMLDDPSLYVRKSVANSLNDVSKDHPDLFLAFAAEHAGGGEGRGWILRRGARTLVKAKDPEALRLFGYAAPPAGRKGAMVATATLEVSPKRVRIGSSAKLSFKVELARSFGGLVRLEYRVTYPVRPGGRPRQKLFFLREREAGKGEALEGARNVPFKDLSIRAQEPGRHGLELLVNGVPVASAELTLIR
jgi:3-methyladenine DNA glycosylase AlkC